jgi:hypothetical protein
MPSLTTRARGRRALFRSTLDESMAGDHACRVIEAFVGKLDKEGLGLVPAEPWGTGGPGYTRGTC